MIMPRRRAGVLIPIELSILEITALSSSGGDRWLHGYALAKRMATAEDAGRLTAHGTLYKALGRLAEAGMLESQWEDADAALAEGRPRRRLYRITGLGQKTLAEQSVPKVGALRFGVIPA